MGLVLSLPNSESIHPWRSILHPSKKLYEIYCRGPPSERERVIIVAALEIVCGRIALVAAAAEDYAFLAAGTMGMRKQQGFIFLQ
jgi:hypothetical protein